MAAMTAVVVALPLHRGWTGKAADEAVFGQIWRIVFASIAAFWVGEFVNAYVKARMRVGTQGRWLWTRTVGSTLVGEGVDSSSSIRSSLPARLAGRPSRPGRCW